MVGVGNELLLLVEQQQEQRAEERAPPAERIPAYSARQPGRHPSGAVWSVYSSCD